MFNVTSEKELFAQIVRGFQPFTIFAKSSILYFWQGFEYVTFLNNKI